MGTLTAANSVFLLTIPGLFSAPQRLQGYATDDAFTTDAIDLADVQMGVDGLMSAGYVPVPIPVAVTLQADSPSNAVFDAWIQTTRQRREVITASAGIQLPSIGNKYSLVKVVLQNAPLFPGTKKVLQPRTFRLMVEGVTRAPI